MFTTPSSGSASYRASTESLSVAGAFKSPTPSPWLDIKPKLAGSAKRQVGSQMTCRNSGATTGICPTRSGSWSVRQLRRSEEHTSELQSRQYLVCRLLLEKKKQL